MTYKLKLKLRDDEQHISIKGRMLRDLQQMNEHDASMLIINTIKQLTTTVHDITWLKRIVFWMPQDKQISQADDAKWFKMRMKFSELREDVPYTITLSQFQVDQIWNRITDVNFGTQQTHVAWVQFLQDFQAATKKSFTSPDPTELDEMVVEYEEE